MTVNDYTWAHDLGYWIGSHVIGFVAVFVLAAVLRWGWAKLALKAPTYWNLALPLLIAYVMDALALSRAGA
jgi:hypothetical protein